MNGSSSLGLFRARLMGVLGSLVAALGVGGAAAGQTVIFVRPGAPSGGTGQSWASAYSDLQPALAAASSVPEATRNIEIWVATGTYYPSARVDASDPRSASFSMLSGVAVLGGFAGQETASSQRDPAARPTVLHGDVFHDDLPDTTNAGNNVYHVVRAINTQRSAVLDGFVITAGSADANGSDGAGVRRDWGGGVAVHTGSGPLDGFTLRNCTVLQNLGYSGTGAGAYCDGGSSVWTGNRFLGNFLAGAGGAGGGVASANGSLTLVNCLFSGNRADRGGAAAPVTATTLAMINCTVFANVATLIGSESNESGRGGAVYFHDFATPSTVSFVARNSVFWANEIRGSAGGLTLWGANGRATFENCIYRDGLSISPSLVTLEGTNYPDADPLILDGDGPDNVYGTADDDPRVSPASVAIDHGSNAAVPAGVFSDLLGRRRFFNPNPVAAQQVDIGAVESGSPAYSPVLYVNAAAAPGGRGDTWPGAYRELREALAVASNTAVGVQAIWVARGTYRPAPPVSQGGSRTASFALQRGLSISGGFVGTENSLSERDPISNPTVLSGDLNGDDLGALNQSDNSLHVVTALNCDETAVLDGVIIQGGRADQVDHREGSAIRIIGAGSPTFRRCTVTGNYAEDRAAVTMSHPAGSPAGPISPLFEDCVFTANQSGAAGAMFHTGPGQARLTRCVFSDNQAFRGPQGIGMGGALLLGWMGIEGGGSAVAKDCVFRGNDTVATSGAVEVDYGSVFQAVNCVFTGNRAGNAQQPTSSGVGVAHVLSGSSATFDGCLMSGNLSRGNASCLVASVGSTIRTRNCTIVANSAAAGAAFGGALATNNNPLCEIFADNCLIWNNSAGGVISEQAQASQVSGGNLFLRNSTVTMWSGMLVGSGNNGLDPLFVRLPSPSPDGLWGTPDDDYGDLRLLATSPAINTADASLLPPDSLDLDNDGDTTEFIPVDLAANPRVFPVSSTLLDRGAYERQGQCPSCPGPRQWQNPLGGSFDEASNWSPAAPDQAHEAVFGIGYSYGVSFPASPATRSVPALTIAAGSIGLNLNQTTLSLTDVAGDSLVVGDSPLGAVLSLSGGRLEAVNAAVATTPGNTGLQQLSVGAGADLVVSRTLTVGFQGSGRMDILSGGRVTSRDATIGDQPGSSGYVSVSGAGSTWDIPFFCIIDNGELNVSSGGVVNVGTGIPFTGIFILNDGRISGDGTINGNVVNFGSISPGNSPGTLTINGGYAQVGQIQNLGAFSGSLNMEIAGSGPGQADHLVINGDAQLGGGMFVRFAPGYQPAAADSFQLVSTTGLIGNPNPSSPEEVHQQFDVIFFPALTAPAVAGKFLRAEYAGLRGPGGNGVTVRLATLPVNAGFGAPSEVPLAGQPAAAALGDLNGDGALDLAIALPGASPTATGTVSILLNDGSGNFTVSTQQIPTGVNPSALAIADFNGDSRNDLAIANAGSDNIRIVRQQASPGTFNDPSPIVIALPAGSAPAALAAGDFDRDTDAAHRVDLAIANSGGSSDTGSITVARNTPNNPFSNPRTIPMPPQKKPTSITPCNPDQDKDLDLAVSSRAASTGAGSVSIFVNFGSTGLFNPPPQGRSEPAVSMNVGAGPVQLLAGEFGPGGASAAAMASPQHQDLVTVNLDGQSLSVLRNTTTDIDQVSFAPQVEYPIDSGTPGLSSSPRSISLVDLDDDDDLDLGVIASTGPVTRVIKVFRNDSTTQTVAGGGAILQVAFSPLADRGAGDCPDRLLGGDVTGDQRADLVTVNTNCQRGTPGSVTLSRNTLPPLPSSLGACCAAGATGLCEATTVGRCATRGGAYRGDNTACTPGLCPFGPTACCRGATCAVAPLSTACTGPNTLAAGVNTVCNAPGNRTSPCCLADFNHSGRISVQDIFDFLAAYFAGDFTTANINGGPLSVQDIFDFLAAYFSGCT